MRKRKIRRSGFNMVEIMLAVIVIALGIAGTFVLFPVGLNANKDATAENSIADIAEYIAAFVQAKVMSSAVSNENGFAFKTKSTELSSIFYTEGNAEIDKKIAAEFDVDKEPDEDTLVSNSSVPLDKSLYQPYNGVYVFRQLSGPADNPYVDFSAVAKVYLDKSSSNSGFEEEHFYSRKDNMPKEYSVLKSELGQDFIGKFLLPVVIELSWPANVPESEREKRYFRFEIFNDQYDVANDTDAQKSAGS